MAAGKTKLNPMMMKRGGGGGSGSARTTMPPMASKMSGPGSPKMYTGNMSGKAKAKRK